MQADALFNLMKAAEENMGLYCGPVPQQMCVDCLKRDNPSCPMKEVHHLAKACEQFTRRGIGFDLNKFEIVPGGLDIEIHDAVDPASVRAALNGIPIFPQPPPEKLE